MKILMIATLLLSTALTTDEKTNSLNGTWIPVSQEIAGKQLPQEFFKNQKLIIADTAYTVVAESVDRGSLVIKGDKMDIYGREGINPGRHFTALMKLEDEKLTICYNLKGDSYPAKFTTADKPGFFLSVFVREPR